MKKLLFTVFAVVGFSAMSVANNHLESKKLKVESVVVVNPCMQDQEAAFLECYSNGCLYWESVFFGAAAWGRCMA